MLDTVYNKFNRGEIDDDALARDDVKKVRNSSALTENFLPLRMGPMLYRPGTKKLGAVTGLVNNIPFINKIDDVASLEFGDESLRIWVDDAPITRTSVTSTITNGLFGSDITGWTDDSGTGSVIAWKTGGYLSLIGTKATSAIAYQTISNTELAANHGLRIVVKDGPINIALGTSGVGSDDIYAGTLKPGTHSLKYTPDANVTITFINPLDYEALIDSVEFEIDGELSLPTTVTEAELDSIRYFQSADVLFCAYDSGKLFDVERRGTESWSVVTYRSDNGPFRPINTTNMTMTTGALNGNTTLTASDDYFVEDHVGALFKLASAGQTVQASVSAADAGTNDIRVTGVGNARIFSVSVSGTFVATVTLQRSSDQVNWEDIENYTSATSKSYDDTLDNSILFYRLHVKSGNYTSGTAVLKLTYSGGSIDGIGRVTEFVSTTVVNIQVVQDFGTTSATVNWYEGRWSDKRGYPTALTMYEGRLSFAGKSALNLSESDAYRSFDRDLEGDSRSIFKEVAFGSSDTVNWLAPSTRLIMGLVTDEVSVRSNSFGEILTQDNVNLKSGSTEGSAPISPLIINEKLYFVQRSLKKIMKLGYTINSDTHLSEDLMNLNENICSAGIKKIVVSRQPETRIWVVLNDGEMRVFLFDPAEDVVCWSRITTDGNIEDAIVLPSAGEDRLYVMVNRDAGRYFEKMALISEASTKYFDSYVEYTSPGTTLTGLSHLEGKTIGVWADDQFRESVTVTGGEAVVSDSWTTVRAGLRFNADYQSNKLSHYVNDSVLTETKRIAKIGLIMRNLWPGALTYGPDFNTLDAMPLMENGKAVDQTALIDEYDAHPFEFNGTYDEDSRVCLRATGPCKILAMVIGVKASGYKKKTDEVNDM